jgi:dipeptidyl aminopeptidase/acylaminoacyl peptidase
MRMLLAAVVLSAIGAQAPQGPPRTEIFLAPLAVEGTKVTVGAAINITNSPGYDNQPSFIPDGSAILFTSDRTRMVSIPVEGVKPPPPQTDVYRYDLASKRIAQVTDTVQSEYSPTVTPDGQGISVIRVESDGTQRLWRFTTAGKEPSVLLTDIKPVGYHAWIDGHTLALFILGERPKPATLQVADTRTGKAQVMAEDIGQSVQRIPAGGISFVHRERSGVDGPATMTVKRLLNGKVEPLVKAVAGQTAPHLAWTADGLLLTAHDGTLYGWRPGDAEWKVLADLNALGVMNPTRLAVSPKSDWLAIVGEAKQ